MKPEEVPFELRQLAIQAMNANDALPEGERDQTPDHILAVVLPEHEKQVRAKVAREATLAQGNIRSVLRGER
jgi:hypothetical protein